MKTARTAAALMAAVMLLGAFRANAAPEESSLYRYCTAIDDHSTYFTAVSRRTHQGAYRIDGVSYLRPFDAFSGWLGSQRGVVAQGNGCVTKFSMEEAQAARDQEIKTNNKRRAVVTEFSVDDK
jgi:hypothetical protein